MEAQEAKRKAEARAEELESLLGRRSGLALQTPRTGRPVPRLGARYSVRSSRLSLSLRLTCRPGRLRAWRIWKSRRFNLRPMRFSAQPTQRQPSGAPVRCHTRSWSVHLGGVLRWDQRDEHHAALGLDAGAAPADRRRHHLVTLFGNCSDGFQKCVVASRRGVASAIYTVP
jgi:hypothetical protein